MGEDAFGSADLCGAFGEVESGTKPFMSVRIVRFTSVAPFACMDLIVGLSLAWWIGGLAAYLEDVNTKDSDGEDGTGSAILSWGCLGAECSIFMIASTL